MSDASPRRLRLFARVLGSAARFGLVAGCAAGLGRAAWIAAANGYVGQRLFRLLADRAAGGFLIAFAATYFVVAWGGVALAAGHAVGRSRRRAWIAPAGAIAFYAATAWLVLRQVRDLYGSFFPVAYQAVPVRFSTVVWNFIVPEGLEKLHRASTAVPALLTWLAWLAGGLAFGLAAQVVVSLPLRKPAPDAEGERGPSRVRRAVLAVSLGVLALALVAWAAIPRLPVPRRPNVVWISLDTLRADHVGCYGYARPTTPRLDALARESVVFDRAISPSPWTLPTHASLFTGLYPSAHGVVEMNTALPEAALTVPEALKNAGYRTSAVVSTYMLSPTYGFGQGFDEFRFRPQAKGPDVTRTALGFLEGAGGRPFFAFVHYFDIHFPWEPPLLDLLPFASADAVRRFAGRTWPHYYDFVVEAMAMLPEELAYRVDAYDAAIRATDRQVGELVDALKAKGLWDETLVVVTSDHGEEWKDHGFLGHSITLFDEVVRVPLLVKPPRSLGIAPRRVPQVVSLVDLAATTAAVAGVTPPGAGSSRDLWPLIRGEAGSWAPVAYSETEIWGPRRRATVVGEFKHVDPFHYRFGDFQGTWAEQVFHHGFDPRERVNLLGTDLALGFWPRFKQADEAFARLVGRSGQPKAKAVALDPATREKLRALGYIQ